MVVISLIVEKVEWTAAAEQNIFHFHSLWFHRKEVILRDLLKFKYLDS